MKLHNSNSITDIPGILVGHASDPDALTGCTVILTETGAVAGVDQRGGAPGTRETDALRPCHLVQRAHAVLLTGGSAFGLDAASGVMKYLEERGVGFQTAAGNVPIVPAAVLFDLIIGRSDIRPDAEMGYQACLNATDKPVEEGNVGAGSGATAGKIFGIDGAIKTGVGSASIHLQDNVIVAALVVVNPFGDIIDPNRDIIIAGARRPSTPEGVKSEISPYADTLEVMKGMSSDSSLQTRRFSGNTIIGVIATNVKMNNEQINQVAQMAHDGVARTIRPAHTMVDGDTLFALSLGKKTADLSLVGALAAEAVSQAIIRSVWAANPAGGLPSAASMKGQQSQVIS